jgi:hypothetical protein
MFIIYCKNFRKKNCFNIKQISITIIIYKSGVHLNLFLE